MGRGTKVVIVCIAVICILIGILWDTVRSGTIGRLDEGANVKVTVKNGPEVKNEIVRPRETGPAGPVAQYDAHDRRDAPALPATPRTHEVKRGESLAKIARQYYGRESLHVLIEKANPGIKPSELREGAKLVIPPAPSAPTDADRSSPLAPPVVAGEAGATRYEVKPGDVGTRIARQVYGNGSPANWERIRKANPGVDDRNLRPGTVLVIPPAK